MFANGNARLAGTLNQSSDRNLKTDVESIDPTHVLNQVAKLPVSSWRYKKHEADDRHIGPMAQDFYKAFKLGTSDKTISVVDGIGVSLAAIKGMNQKMEALENEVEAKEDRINELEDRLAILEAAILESNR